MVPRGWVVVERERARSAQRMFQPVMGVCGVGGAGWMGGMGWVGSWVGGGMDVVMTRRVVMVPGRSATVVLMGGAEVRLSAAALVVAMVERRIATKNIGA